ncbi:hypothetical protein C8R44DRAFT_883644 [Mycena epipterygia]|nr:hypothetical protein C8R44DRAFT_883644 [Mycena epipterygia]
MPRASPHAHTSPFLFVPAPNISAPFSPFPGLSQSLGSTYPPPLHFFFANPNPPPRSPYSRLPSRYSRHRRRPLNAPHPFLDHAGFLVRPLTGAFLGRPAGAFAEYLHSAVLLVKLFLRAASHPTLHAVAPPPFLSCHVSRPSSSLLYLPHPPFAIRRILPAHIVPAHLPSSLLMRVPSALRYPSLCEAALVLHSPPPAPSLFVLPLSLSFYRSALSLYPAPRSTSPLSLSALPPALIPPTTIVTATHDLSALSLYLCALAPPLSAFAPALCSTWRDDGGVCAGPHLSTFPPQCLSPSPLF